MVISLRKMRYVVDWLSRRSACSYKICRRVKLVKLFLHTYALACEFLRCLDVRETGVYPSEKGYGALLQSEENARNREQRIIHCLQSVLLYASAHSRSFALSKLPEREKSEVVSSSCSYIGDETERSFVAGNFLTQAISWGR